MEHFLIILLRLSLSGSLLAGLLILLRGFLQKWVGPSAFYYLWLLVLLRLCIPAGVALPLPAALNELDAAVSSPAGIPAPAPSLDGTADSPILIQPIPAPVPPDASPVTPDTSDRTKHQNWSILPGILWILGAAICLGWYAGSYRHFSRQIKEACIPPSSQALAVLREMDSADQAGLAECPLVSTPMLLGVLHPVIVLPVGIEGKERLEDILTHELTHARRRDVLYKWFAVGVTSLHWFNPLMLLVRREINRTCELSCDEAVIRGLDKEGRRHYGQTLLDLAASPPSRLGRITITLCEEKAQLKERLVSIVNYRKKGAAAIIATLLLSLTMVGCALVNGAEPSQPQTDNPPQEPVNGPSQAAIDEPPRAEADEMSPLTGLEDSQASAPNDSAVPPVAVPEEEREKESVSVTVSGGRRLTLEMQDKHGVNSDSDYGPTIYNQIQVFDGSDLIQTITQDDVDLNQGYLFDGFLAYYLEPQVQDVNFDGVEDIGFMCGTSYNGPLCWFVWDQADEQFRFAFYSSLDLTVDQDNYQLIDAWRDGSMGMSYYTYAYNEQQERVQIDYRFSPFEG